CVGAECGCWGCGSCRQSRCWRRCDAWARGRKRASSPRRHVIGIGPYANLGIVIEVVRGINEKSVAVVDACRVGCLRNGKTLVVVEKARAGRVKHASEPAHNPLVGGVVIKHDRIGNSSTTRIDRTSTTKRIGNAEPVPEGACRRHIDGRRRRRRGGATDAMNGAQIDWIALFVIDRKGIVDGLHVMIRTYGTAGIHCKVASISACGLRLPRIDPFKTLQQPEWVIRRRRKWQRSKWSGLCVRRRSRSS